MNFKAIIQKTAPLLGAAIGGPIGATAGQLLSKALGTKPDAGIADVAKAVLGATDEQLAALKAQEGEFALKMKQYDIQTAEDVNRLAEEMEKIASDDRASARSRQVGMKDWTPTILAIAITVGFFTTLWWVFIHGVPPESRDMAFAMVGTLGTAWASVMNFYFGSSAGSARKTELLAGKPAVS